MDGEIYDLFFGTLKVGVLTKIDSDFPNTWGMITYDPGIEQPKSPEALRLARFIELMKAWMQLIKFENESHQENSNEQEVVNTELEAQFIDIIESDEWKLVRSDGRELPILCPTFHKMDEGELDEVVWRWNVR
jgi:hypothetical protein